MVTLLVAPLIRDCPLLLDLILCTIGCVCVCTREALIRSCKRIVGFLLVANIESLIQTVFNILTSKVDLFIELAQGWIDDESKDSVHVCDFRYTVTLCYGSFQILITKPRSSAEIRMVFCHEP